MNNMYNSLHELTNLARFVGCYAPEAMAKECSHFHPEKTDIIEVVKGFLPRKEDQLAETGYN